MSKEAMKLALEALIGARAFLESDAPVEIWGLNDKAITALREALAEQPAQQEPVVWMYVNRSTHETIFQRHMRSFVDHGNWTETPLYSEPLANHELICVCGAVWCGDEMVHLPHKSTSPQRKPLTDEQIEREWQFLHDEEGNPPDHHDFARAIEAKLKEKNNG